jgi:signal-transduction protein with cAMP-binding, CBS, and nucleotidyltransferase domain
MDVEKLQGQDLFALLTPKEVEVLSNACGVVSLKKGERVYSVGFPASHLFVLLKGRVELRRPTKGGLSLLVDDIPEGGVFGVSSLTKGERYLLNAQCVEDSDVLKVESSTLRGLLDQNPAAGYAIERRICQIFFKRYVDAMERLQGVAQAVPLGPP